MAKEAGAGVTGTKESATAGAALPSETTPTAAEVRKAEADLQRSDDVRREYAADFEAQQLIDRDEHWVLNAKSVRAPHEFLPADKVTVTLPEGHPNL